MSIKGKILLTFVLVVAFTVAFNCLVPSSMALLLLWSEQERTLSDVPSWSISLLISIVLVLKSRLVERVVFNWGTKLLIIGVLILALVMILITIGLVLDSRVIFMSSYYLLLIAHLPLKIIIMLGLFIVLLSLKANERVLQAKHVDSKGYRLIIVLGFAMLFQPFFAMISNYSVITLPRIIVFGFGLGWVIPLLVAYFL